MLSPDQLRHVLGQTAYGADGEKLGKVSRIFLDNASGLPEWVTVQTGLFGTRESFVPAGDAELTDSGITLPFGKDAVKAAPQVDADSGELSPEEEAELYRHYQLAYTTPSADDDVATAETSGGYLGQTTSAQGSDDAMTRSEERLHVGTRRVATERVRLRKYVVTEEKTITVPVTHEEVRLERVPMGEEAADDLTDASDIAAAEAQVILSEERVVVSKESVPVERVRLRKETVTEQQQVTEQLRKERIETEGDIAPIDTATDIADGGGTTVG